MQAMFQCHPVTACACLLVCALSQHHRLMAWAQPCPSVTPWLHEHAYSYVSYFSAPSHGDMGMPLFTQVQSHHYIHNSMCSELSMCSRVVFWWHGHAYLHTRPHLLLVHMVDHVPGSSCGSVGMLVHMGALGTVLWQCGHNCSHANMWLCGHMCSHVICVLVSSHGNVDTHVHTHATVFC